ncbi:MAG: PepSY-like domain-containing protein [Bacteroidota bacterium]|nr:PepSY-like domain-containing protein [Bacteroidota bacterium]
MKSYQFLKQSFNVIILIMFYSIMNNVIIAQDKKYSEKDVPPVVLESFKKLYPNTIITGYEVENEKGVTIYEIESKDGSLQRDVEFTADGNVIEIGEFISAITLPANVTSSIRTIFNNAKILEAEKKTRGTEISYEIVIEDKNKKKEVLMDQNGNLLKDTDDNNDDDNNHNDD